MEQQKLAFTMAEILLSLTIIGVVAAITLPSLTGNINERTWNTQRKALYARFSQAIALMPALNGYGTLEDGDPNNVAETFITNGLTKVLKINNICDNEHLADCGIISHFTNLGGSTSIQIPQDLYSLNEFFSSANHDGKNYSVLNTKAAAFETQNGESIVLYYNPACTTEYRNVENLTYYGYNYGFAQARMCANFIFDLNGTKGPNTVGKDIGWITVFNATDSTVVAPFILSRDASATATSQTRAVSACKTQDSESRIPNIEELDSMFINKTLAGITTNKYWSGTLQSSSAAWYENFDTGVRLVGDKNWTFLVRCVKR